MQETREIHWLAVVNVLLRHATGIILTSVAVAALFVALRVLGGKEYAASSRFVPQRTSEASRLSGIAAQFGFSVGRSQDAESVDFYAQLVRSRDLLRDLATSAFAFEMESGRRVEGTLTDLLAVRGDDAADSLRHAISRLMNLVATRVALNSNMVTVTTRAPWPTLAERMNARILDLVNDFNLSRRQSTAAAERAFIEERLNEARAELERAEDALRAFRERNRIIADSPLLGLENARLSRQVEHRQSVYVTLSEAYEQARIDEVRDTPVVTVVEEPDGSARKVGSTVMTAILGGALGLAFACVVVFLAEYVSHLRAADDPAYAEFRSLLSRRGRARPPGAPSGSATE